MILTFVFLAVASISILPTIYDADDGRIDVLRLPRQAPTNEVYNQRYNRRFNRFRYKWWFEENFGSDWPFRRRRRRRFRNCENACECSSVQNVSKQSLYRKDKI